MILLAFLLTNWRIQFYQLLDTINTATCLACLAVKSFSMTVVFILTEITVKSKGIVVYKRSFHGLMPLSANHKWKLLFCFQLCLSHKNLTLISALHANLEVKLLPYRLADNRTSKTSNMKFTLFILILTQQAFPRM